MPKTAIKAGSKVLCVEGVDQGESGTVTHTQRLFDGGHMRWVVWFDNDKGKKIRTRLNWVRETE